MEGFPALAAVPSQVVDEGSLGAGEEDNADVCKE